MEVVYDPNDDGWDVVYVPSQSIEPEEIAKLVGFVHYEVGDVLDAWEGVNSVQERPLLSCLLRLSLCEASRCVYVSSVEIPDQAMVYYLSVCTGESAVRESILSRLLLLHMGDDSPLALTEKLNRHPEMIARIRSWIRPASAFLRCIISTPYEENLSRLLEIPLRANPPSYSYLGTKHGSRTIFQEAGIRKALPKHHFLLLLTSISLPKGMWTGL